MRIFMAAIFSALICLSAGCTQNLRTSAEAGAFTVRCGESWAICEANARQACNGEIKVLDKQQLTDFSNNTGDRFATHAYVGTFECAVKPPA